MKQVNLAEVRNIIIDRLDGDDAKVITALLEEMVAVRARLRYTQENLNKILGIVAQAKDIIGKV